LNVDETDAVELLAGAELIDGAVRFAGDSAPDGWLDTGNSTTLLQFVAGSSDRQPRSVGREPCTEIRPAR